MTKNLMQNNLIINFIFNCYDFEDFVIAIIKDSYFSCINYINLITIVINYFIKCFTKIE